MYRCVDERSRKAHHPLHTQVKETSHQVIFFFFVFKMPGDDIIA